MTTLEQVQEFWAWVNQVRKNENLSFRAIERAGGLSNGALSARESAMREPTFKNCVAIAKAFYLPVSAVLIKGGLLPEDTKLDGKTRELLFYYDQMTPEMQIHFRRMARTIAESRGDYEAPG